MEERKEIYSDLRVNAAELDKLLSSKDMELADVALLMKQRDKIFTRLTQIHDENGVLKEESELLENALRDNTKLYEKITEKKTALKKEFKKKESEAKKISEYAKR